MPSRTDRSSARERIAARRAAEEARRQAAQRRKVQLTVGAVVAAVLVVAIVVTVLVQQARTDTTGSASPRNTASGTGGTAFALGQADAPVVVDVYEDYQCPACRALEADAGNRLDQLAADGKALVRLHPVAILDHASDDRYSSRAANAAAVVADARDPEVFRTFTTSLFDHQPAENGPGLTDDQLVDLAAQAGAKGSAVGSGIRDGRFADWVARATDKASRDGLTATPMVLVDGEQLPAPSADSITAAVQAAAG
jgi:protein-disulfide isomerase